MTEHIKTRHKVKDIGTPKEFEDILSGVILSDEDKQILRMHYIGKDLLMEIAMKLGYSERTVKRRHKSALRKIAKIL